MTQLNDLLIKNGFSKKLLASDIDFQAIEKILGIQLPRDYKHYLSNYNNFEGFVGKEYLRVWDVDNLLKLNKGYGINDLKNIVAIGTNGSGECIAIDFSNNNAHIILAPFVDPDKTNHIEIGTSFLDMFVRLDSGKEWFNSI